jgi:hypothetical protein
MKNTVIITAQYFENYNVGPEGFNTYGDKQPQWKPKGSHQFKLEIDADMLMYTDANAILSKMVESHNSVAEKFEYVDYEVQWSQPTLLGTDDDYRQIYQQLEEAC